MTREQRVAEYLTKSDSMWEWLRYRFGVWLGWYAIKHRRFRLERYARRLRGGDRLALLGGRPLIPDSVMKEVLDLQPSNSGPALKTKSATVTELHKREKPRDCA